MKKLLKSPLIHWLLAIILYLYTIITYATQRKQFKNLETLHNEANKNEALIIVFWHGRLLFTPLIKKKADIQKLSVVVSRHNDGDIIAKLAGLFKTDTIRGSSDKRTSTGNIKDKGGKHALREIMQHLKTGHPVAITPDGPRGPRMHMQGNILHIAQRYNTTILPITFSSSHAKIFNSWDKFMLPIPFGRTHFIVGEPIQLNKDFDDETLEKTRKTIENQLNTITTQADTMVGRNPIQPASM